MFEEGLEDEMDLIMQRTGQGCVLGWWQEQGRAFWLRAGTFKGPEAWKTSNSWEAVEASVVVTQWVRGE